MGWGGGEGRASRWEGAAASLCLTSYPSTQGQSEHKGHRAACASAQGPILTPESGELPATGAASLPFPLPARPAPSPDPKPRHLPHTPHKASEVKVSVPSSQLVGQCGGVLYHVRDNFKETAEAG